MMRMSNIQMKTTVDRQKLLDRLQKNLAEHKQIVKEAIDGYIKQAKEEVSARLEELRSGKVVALHFSLEPPHDYSEVYATTIKMLQWSTEASVVLAPDEFRQLVEDKWDWMGDFLASNSRYSGTARTKMSSM